MVSAIIAAAGTGSRMGAGENKVFLKLLDKTVLEHTVLQFMNSSLVDEIIIVTGEEDIKRVEGLFLNSSKPVKVIKGGKVRQESVLAGILASKGDIVAIHDGARALITTELIEKVIEECKIHKAAALGVVAKDTIKIVDDNGFIKCTTDREKTYQIQTPQIFTKELILKAHSKCAQFVATDDCSLVENIKKPVKVVLGSYENIKLTTPEDLILAEGILAKRR